MIGNDIIDLRLAISENKSANQRYRNKAFTKSENRLIDLSKDPELTIWQIWAAKESAYKLHQRTYKLEPKLNPLSFNCSYQNKNSIIVITEQQQYFVSLKFGSSYIYAETTTETESKICRKIFDKQSSYEDYLQLFSEENMIKRDQLQLVKDQYHIPSILNSISEEMIPVSITHHGKFSALAFPLINS